MELFKAINLSISVEDSYIINNLNFSINEGEFVGFYGKNSETHSLFKTLYLDQKYINGELTYVGQELSSFNMKEVREWRINDIAYVNKQSLFSNISIFDNIIMPMTINRYEYEESYVNSLIEILKIDTFIDKKIEELTTYQKYLVIIARSMSIKPFVLFIDDLDKYLSSSDYGLLLEALSNINNMFKTTIICNYFSDQYAHYFFKNISIGM